MIFSKNKSVLRRFYRVRSLTQFRRFFILYFIFDIYLANLEMGRPVRNVTFFPTIICTCCNQKALQYKHFLSCTQTIDKTLAILQLNNILYLHTVWLKTSVTLDPRECDWSEAVSEIDQN